MSIRGLYDREYKITTGKSQDAKINRSQQNLSMIQYSVKEIKQRQQIDFKWLKY